MLAEGKMGGSLRRLTRVHRLGAYWALLLYFSSYSIIRPGARTMNHELALIPFIFCLFENQTNRLFES